MVTWPVKRPIHSASGLEPKVQLAFRKAKPLAFWTLAEESFQGQTPQVSKERDSSSRTSRRMVTPDQSGITVEASGYPQHRDTSTKLPSIS